MSLNNSQMLPARIRNMRQMNEVLNAEDIILAEIERIIDEMYQRASLLHEELVNEEWLENKLSERTGAGVKVTGYAEKLLAEIVLNVSELHHIDMPDVRGFLNKWVPAHLMYKIILLLDYSSGSSEKFTVTEMTIGFDAPYWNVRRLNGTWLLDGSNDLSMLRKPDTYGLMVELGNTGIREITSGDVVIKKDLWLLNGSYQLNGTRILDAIRREEEL